MKTYSATYWRSNPQLKDGGYYTTRSIKAKDIRQARKKANEIANSCLYGTMTLDSLNEEVCLLLAIVLALLF